MSAPVPDAARPRDATSAWILWVALLGVALLAAAWSVVFFFLLAIACGTPDACSDRDADIIWAACIALWVLLVVSVLVPLVMVVVLTTRRRRSWPWPTVGLAVVVVATIGWTVGLFALLQS